MGIDNFEPNQSRKNDTGASFFDSRVGNFLIHSGRAVLAGLATFAITQLDRYTAPVFAQSASEQAAPVNVEKPQPATRVIIEYVRNTLTEKYHGRFVQGEQDGDLVRYLNSTVVTNPARDAHSLTFAGLERFATGYKKLGADVLFEIVGVTRVEFAGVADFRTGPHVSELVSIFSSPYSVEGIPGYRFQETVQDRFRLAELGLTTQYTESVDPYSGLPQVDFSGVSGRITNPSGSEFIRRGLGRLRADGPFYFERSSSLTHHNRSPLATLPQDNGYSY